jgi:hypothetical protein
MRKSVEALMAVPKVWIGCGLMANCLAERTPGAALLGTIGFGLFVRAVTDMDFGRLLGMHTTGRPGTSRRQPAASMGIAQQPVQQANRAQPARVGGF